MPERTQILLATRRFDVERIMYAVGDGCEHAREVIRHPGAVAILPLLDEQTVCLIRNVRPAVNKTLVELPAGTLEKGELPEETARRELLEETGYQAGRLTAMPSFFLSPGILDERMHLFLAEELTMAAPRREPGEQIENLVLTWEEAMQMVAAGQIEDAKTLVGLLLFDQQRRARRG